MYRNTDNIGRDNFPPDDNPFGESPAKKPVSNPNICGVIVGLAQSDMTTFLKCFSKATRDWVFYIRRDYKEGCLLAFDFAEWDNNNIALKRMRDFLRLLAETGRPVAFIRFGYDFEAWANDEGHRIFSNRVSCSKEHCAIVFAPDDDEESLRNL